MIVNLSSNCYVGRAGWDSSKMKKITKTAAAIVVNALVNSIHLRGD